MPQDESDAVKIPAPRGDEKEKEKSLDEKRNEDLQKQAELLKKKPDSAPEAEDLSEEDKKLKEQLELFVKTVKDKAETPEQIGVQRNALEGLGQEIRSSTSSMTSVPKPLKFLRPHYDSLKETYTNMPASENKLVLADILSVLAMTMAASGSRESLRFKLEGQKQEGVLTSWGHQYVRHLAGEVGEEFAQREQENKPYDDLNHLIDQMVPFNMKHNAEVDAIDLLLEVSQLSKLSSHVNKDNHSRVCSYLLQCADYLGDPDESAKLMELVFDIYLSCQQYPDALRVAIKCDDKEKMARVFESAEDRLVKKQLAFLLASQRVFLSALEGDDELVEIMGNVQLNARFLSLAADLDVKDAKTPEDIYKSHLVEGHAKGGGAGGVDSAKQNLASSFVNAFVNAGFGKDKLMTLESGADWVYKNKGHGQLSAVASLGMVLLWDLENGFSAVDKYTFSNQPHIKAGALLATGMVSSGVTSEMDAALGLLQEHVEGNDPLLKTAAVFGLGLAYAGTCRQDVLELLVPVVVDSNQPMEVSSLAALALGLVFTGTADADVSSSLLEGFLDRSDTDLKDSSTKLMCLGMGLLFLGQGEKIEGTLEAIKAIEHPIRKYLEQAIITTAYVGTGSVLEVQKLLSILSDHMEDDEKNPLANAHQALATLGIALVCKGSELGEAMALRALDHVLQYSEVNVRRIVPLALGMISLSNPRLTVMDTLSKLSHDQDEVVSQAAVLSLGLLGAGTNNSRIASLLRSLAAYYAKEPNHLFLVRIAQGLLHMGKGLVSLNPFHSDSLLMNKVSMAGLLVVLHACCDLKNNILGNRHFLLYSLVCSMRPRMLVTLDEDLKSIPVSVRVGQAVDTVGQAGRPKAITGFQTHTTPVLIGHGDRAELSTDEYIPLTNVLEGFVILRKNPDAQKE